jgi:hypothetical protein
VWRTGLLIKKAPICMLPLTAWCSYEGEEGLSGLHSLCRKTGMKCGEKIALSISGVSIMRLPIYGVLVMQHFQGNIEHTSELSTNAPTYPQFYRLYPQLGAEYVSPPTTIRPQIWGFILISGYEPAITFYMDVDVSRPFSSAISSSRISISSRKWSRPSTRSGK